MFSPLRQFACGIVCITCSVGLLAQSPQSAAPATHLEQSLPVEQLALFAEILQQVKDNYVEDIDDETLLQYAISGMIEGLDPHSAFLDKEALQDLTDRSQGQYVGLGVEISTKDGFLKVISPIDGSPAQKAGIKSGDIIVEIDGRPVKGMKLNDAVESLRGTVNSSIALQIKRENQKDLLNVTVVRELIKNQSTHGKLLEPGYAYVRIALFQKDTGVEINKVIRALQAENKQPLQGLVLDLRNNPGGILEAAVGVADAFLETGSIVSIRGRHVESPDKYEALPGDILQGKPIIILINEGSASASEIVAGALQDHKRAVVLGTTSFGKGSVQRVYNVSPTAGLKLTIARYYTPNGRSIQGTGITPDIVLSPVTVELKQNPKFLKEKDLAGALNNDAKTQNQQAYVDSMKALVSDDYQLFEAINILKTISILGFNQQNTPIAR